MKIRGLIFDFNGVLVNDEPVHCYGFQQALKEENLHLALDEYYEKYLPYDDYNFFVNFFRDRGKTAGAERIAQLMALKSKHYFEAIGQEIPVIQSSVDFIRSIPADIPLAIASGAVKKEIQFILSELGLPHRFNGIIAAGDVINGKPHPEAFLKALECLRNSDAQMQPAQVVVFEDSYRGVASAQSAGMKCVALTTSYPADRLTDADWVVDSLESLTLEQLEQKLNG